MARQNLWRGFVCPVLSVVLGTVLAGFAVAQDAPATPKSSAVGPGQEAAGRPATQPAEPDAQESLRKLMEIKAQADRERQKEGAEPSEEAAASQPVELPDDRRRLEDLARRARTSTQEARETEEDDFFGPEYPPAAPADRGRAMRGGERRPATRPGRAVEPEHLEPPVSKASSTSEWFNYVGSPWEDVIQDFAERIGKPLMTMDELIIGGELTYVSEREFTKEEAIDELNLIMHMLGYRFVETEHHIFVVPLSEMNTYVDVESVYPTRQAFEEADPRPMDYVTVYVQIKDQPAKKIQLAFETMLPDYMTIMTEEDSNQLKLVGLVRDIHKMLGLMDRVPIAENDPRETRIFSIETNAQDIERMVRDILGLGSAARVTMQRDPRTRRMVPTTTPESESDVRMTADDRTNTIIVRATPAKLKEIEELIKQIDKRPDLDFYTEVTEIKNANAVDVAELLNKILSQEQGTTTPTWQRLRQLQQQQARTARGRRTTRQPTPAPQQATPEELLGEGLFERAKKTIRIAADERTNSIIVYANKDGHEKVQKLLVDIDEAQPSNLRTFAMENAEAAQIYPTLNQIVQNMSGMARGKAPSIVLDEANNVFHVLAEREQMQQIEEAIKQLDVPMPEAERHIVELKNLVPSRVAQMIQPLLTSGGGGRAASPASPVRRRFPQRGVSPGATTSAGDAVQIIPLDEAQLLIVVCADEDWEKVEATIKLWDDKATFSTPKLHTFEIAAGDPQAIAQTLNEMYRGQYNHPAFGRSQVMVEAQGNAIMVYAIQPAVDEIAPLIEALDREDASKYEILPLAHADAAQVAQEAAQLFAGVSGRGRGRGGLAAGGVVIQAEPVTNSLIVQADPVTLDKIKDFAMQRDQSVAAQLPEQRFFTLRYAQPREVAGAVAQMYGGGPRQRGLPVGTQIKAVASGAHVIIEAPKEKMAEIEAFIAQLDDPQGQEIVIKTIKLPGADVTQIASKLNGAFREKRNVTARFDPDPQSETILLTCSKDALPEAERLIGEYAEASKGILPQVEFHQMTYAPAPDAANWLRDQLVTYMQQQLGRNAAAQIRVTADPRTNRVVINGPQVAVEYGKALLAQYDVAAEQPPVAPVETVVRKLAGLDVRSLASTLTATFRPRPRRPDGLSPSFQADAVTETLVISAPKDMFEEINGIIATFEAEAEELKPEQKFIEVVNADANYVASQLQGLLVNQLVRTRGRAVADRVSITVDQRLNRLVINAPKFVLPLAEAIIYQLDEVAPPREQIRTIALKTADANVVVGILNTVLREKIKQKRTLQISAEPMTNSIIVSADKEDFEEIERWAQDLDDRAVGKGGELKIVDVLNANPWELVNILNARYSPKGYGQRNRVGQEMSFYVVAGRSIAVLAPKDTIPEIEATIAQLDLPDTGDSAVTIELKYADPNQIVQMINAMFQASGRSQLQQVRAVVSNGMLVVRAPQNKLAEIQELIAAVDSEDKEALQIKTYQLKVLNAREVAAQVQLFLRSVGSQQRRGQMQPGAFAEPTTNTLVVIAPEKQLPFIDGLVLKLESVERKDSEARAYVLKHARAEQVAQSVDAMLKAKVAEREGDVRRQTIQTGVFSDTTSNRLFVFAPDEYQALAGDLIRIIDEDVDTGEVVHIIQLEQADATQLAQTLQQVAQGGGPRGRGAAAGQQVRITADAGSNSILLAGLPQDVAEIEGYIEELEVNSETIPELQIMQLENASALDVAETLNSVFGATARGGRRGSPLEAVTITADDYYNRLLVTANKRKMRQVEAFVAQLDVAPTREEGDLFSDPCGRQLYFVDVFRGDAFDIAWDVRDMLPDPERCGPVVEADWFGKYIKVKCRESEFEQVLALIRQFEKRARVEAKVVTRQLKGDPESILAYLRKRMPEEDLDIQYLADKEKPPTIVESLWDEDEEPPWKQRQRERRERRERQESVKPVGTTGEGVRPFRLGLPVTAALLADIEAELFGEQPAAQPQRTAQPPAEKPQTRPAAASEQKKPLPPGVRMPGAPADEERGGEAEPQKEKTRIVVQPDGSVVIYGPRGDVEEVEEAIDLLEEDLDVGEVIRIFEFKYGDVTAAAEVIQIMFNERQVFQLPQQPQQRVRPGQRGQEGREEQQGLMEQYRGMVGMRQQDRRGRTQTGPRVRIATDPGHNYLIIKCNESDLPEIKQLLRELDIPPGEVELKVFQLRNLDATETAANIKDVLGISKVQQRRAGPPARMPRGRGSAQAQLMEMLQQQMVSVPGVEGGAKVEQVEIVPNAVTNALMVSAPPEVMTIIANVITELEELEGHGVVGIYHYALEDAKVDEILPLLQDIFSAIGGAGGGRPGAGRRGGAPGALGPVTVSGDPRVNTIIYTCEAKDRDIVEAQIRMLDIAGAVAEAETYVCKFGDAQAIAEVVEAIYGDGGGGPRRGPRGGAAQQVSGQEVRIVAEPTTNTIVVWGPPDKRDAIFAKIEELDLRGKRDIREISVIYADPEDLAETLLQMFGGSGGQQTPGRGRRGGVRAAGGTAAGGIVIIGDKNAKKLLVRAPDEVFLQIEDVVATLDQPDERLQIRRYALEHADAEVVVESLKGALAEYVAMLGRGADDLPFDPFTVVPDPRTNSIIVVGSQQTFTFVDSVLDTIDVETPAEQRDDFRVFVLEKADAEFVAQAINDFATGGAGMTGTGTSGRGGGGRRMPGAGTVGLARALDVYASADTTANTVMIFGKSEDIDIVEDQIILKYEGAIRDRLQIATIPVEQVKPTEIVSFIWQFIGEPEAAGGTTGGQRRGQRRTQGEAGGPQIIPNDNAGTLVVRGTRGDIEYVRELVAEFDHPGLIQQNIKVIKVPSGQDVLRLATEVERLVNDSEADIAEQTGRRARRVTIAADEFTKTLIVAGDPVMFGFVTSVIDQLAEVRRDNVVTRVINLGNLSAEDAKQMIEDLQRRGGTSGSSGTRRGSGARPTGGSRSSGSRRRGDANWPQLRGIDSGLWQSPALACASPYVSVALLSPGIAVALAEPPQDRDQDEPVRERAGPAPASKPAVRAAAEEEVPSAAEPAPQPPPAEPVPGLTGITGELRGEVLVSEVDSKRIIITGDESDVAFIEQILLMMEQSASPAVIEVFTIENAKATVLAPIIEAAIEALIDARTTSPGPEDRFSVSAEGRSNSLIVSASERMMEEIAALIEQLDVEKPDVEVGPRAVALKHVRATEAVTLIKPALEELYRIQEVPKESQASVSAIDRSNSVLIVGTPKDAETIERLLRTIDVEITAEDEQASFVYADVILIPLQNGQAEDVAKVLMDMIEEQQERAREAQSSKDRAAEPYVTKLRLRTADGRELPELNLERPIGIIPEKGTNSLMIFSSMDNTESLTEIVRVFDTLPVGAETEVKAITLKHAGAEDVAQVLADVFQDARKALARPVDGDNLPSDVMPPVPPGVTGKGLPYNLVVQHDVRSNVIIVVGRKDAVLLAASLIAELDKPSLDLAGQPYVIALKNYQATALAEKMQELLDDRAQALGADQNAARDSAVVMADERSNSLVVVATPEVFDMLEDLAMQLDAAENYRIVATRYRRLEYADAQKLAGLLQELFARKQDAESKQSNESKDTLDVIPDTRSNSLVLVGTRDYLAEADAMVDNLDQSFDRTVVMKVVPVRLNSAANIAVLLQDMVDKALKEQDSKLEGTPIHIAAEPLSDSLLLAASQEDMTLLERWIEILDRPSEVGRMTGIYPLRRASAEEVAKAASDIFSKTGGESKIDVTVTHDPTTNSVVAFGPPAILKDIAAFVRELDQTDPGIGTMVKIFKLEQADAEDAGDLLTSILELRSGTVGGGGRAGGGGANEELEKQVMLLFQKESPELGIETLRAMRSEISVISDLRTNSLVVTAPPESMPLMESLVALIDVPPDAAKIRVFALRNADAEQMVEMLKELFEQERAGGGRGDEESERELTLAEGGVGGRQEVSFTTDTRTNSVIAAGTPGYLDLVEELVLELDSKTIEQRKTMVYPPRNMVAADLAPVIRDFSEQEQALLQELGDEISLERRQEREIIAIAHEESNQIILGYNPRIEAEVLDIVRELDQPPPQVSIEVLIVEVSMENSLELGVEFAFQDLQWTKAGPQDTTTFDFVGGTDVGAAGAGLGGFTFTITGRDFNFLLRTLQSENALEVLSRPHIVAMDNQPASIEITDNVPYVSGTTITTGGISQTNVSREDVGIKLEVTPQINPDGYVRLEIRQEVSDLSDSTVPLGQGLTAPIFFKRIAETVVTVQDNETVVLGGLIQTRDSKTEQKIPLVGDLPVLGPLFRFTDDGQRRSELLVILTPRVIRTIEDYRELSVEARDQTGLISDELKTNPLMRGLQVRPEELIPVEGEELFGPFEGPLPLEEEDTGGEEYGPTRPAATPARRGGGASDADSYDVPISMLTRRS